MNKQTAIPSTVTEPPSGEDYGAFLCHRREGGKDQARLLKAEIEHNGIKTFLDIDGLGPGDWETNIFKAIDASRKIIVVLTHGSLEKCCDAADMMRREIEYSRGKGKTIIPVRWEGFSWPEGEKDSEIAIWLKQQQYRSHTHEYFDYFIEKLVEWLNR